MPQTEVTVQRVSETISSAHQDDSTREAGVHEPSWGGCEVEVERSRLEVGMEKDRFMVRTRRRRTQWDSGSGTLICHHQQALASVRLSIGRSPMLCVLRTVLANPNGVTEWYTCPTKFANTPMPHGAEHRYGEGTYPLG